PGRLASRARKPARNIAPGEHVLFDDSGRRSLLFVPSSYDPKRLAPFLLALHGATGSGDSMLRGTRAAAEGHGVVVLSPSSRSGSTNSTAATRPAPRCVRRRCAGSRSDVWLTGADRPSVRRQLVVSPWGGRGPLGDPRSAALAVVERVERSGTRDRRRPIIR